MGAPLNEPSGAAASAVARSGFDCQACGACCAYSATWPRFTTEDEIELAQIPEAHVAADGSGMRCHGERCTALVGEIGRHTACAIYGVRPDVCRVCLPGDPECLVARAAHGLPCGH